jgi:hypothetical protein
MVMGGIGFLVLVVTSIHLCIKTRKNNMVSPVNQININLPALEEHQVEVPLYNNTRYEKTIGQSYPSTKSKPSSISDLRPTMPVAWITGPATDPSLGFRFNTYIGWTIHGHGSTFNRRGDDPKKKIWRVWQKSSTPFLMHNFFPNIFFLNDFLVV